MAGTSAMGRPQRPLRDRFFQCVEVGSSDGCWNWTKPVATSGYGRIYEGPETGKTVGAHRVSWMLHMGSIPEGQQVLHHCDNRRCVNPDHLFLGSPSDNMADKVSKGRHRSLSGMDNPATKLNEQIVEEIRAAYAGGASQSALAERFGVSQTLISAIVRRKIWQ